MIAVALALISVVVMVSTGVVVSSSEADRLTFLGVSAQATTAQVFMTGAIFAWVFMVALWLLRVGMQRSGARYAHLPGRWVGLGSTLGFGSQPGPGRGRGLPGVLTDGYGSTETLGFPALSGSYGAFHEEGAGAGFYGAEVLGADRARGALGADGFGAGGTSLGGSGDVVGPESTAASGASGDVGSPPRRIHGRPDVADGPEIVRAVAREQPRTLPAGDRLGPGAGLWADSGVRIAVNGGGQSGELGGIPRFMPREYGGPHGDSGEGARRDETGQPDRPDRRGALIGARQCLSVRALRRRWIHRRPPLPRGR